VGAHAVGGVVLDFGNDVVGLHEVDKGSGAELFNGHLLLLVTTVVMSLERKQLRAMLEKNVRVNSNNPQTHSLCVLLCERSQTTSSTDNGNGLTWTGTRFLETLVDSDTGAKDWSDTVQGNLLVETGNVCGLGNGVLLEGSIDSVAR